jgi:hypothetical protein
MIVVQDQPRQRISKISSQPSGGALLSSQTMWETEIGRIEYTGQPGQKVVEIPFQHKKSWEW